MFTFSHATKGANDGYVKMTYLNANTKFEPGKFYHVVGVYDGQQMQLYVNGQLDGESTEQTGEVLYPESAPLVLGAYHDRNEFYSLRGKLREVALYHLAAKPKWVEGEFAHQKDLVEYVSKPVAGGLDFIVRPFLQYGTETGMTVVWQTTAEAKS
ncbi:MAG: LamG domain-containing protein, partial [Planctomycetota bacterium]